MSENNPLQYNAPTTNYLYIIIGLWICSQWRGLRGRSDRRGPGAGGGRGRTTGADRLRAGLGAQAEAGKPKWRRHAMGVAYGSGRVHAIPLHSDVTACIDGLFRKLIALTFPFGKTSLTWIN